jgi:hypothetical protein
MKKLFIIPLLALATIGMAFGAVRPAMAAGDKATAQAQVTALGCIPNSQPPLEEVQVTFNASYTTYRTITLYQNDQEYYSDVTQVRAGTTDTSYLALQNGEWYVVVRLGNDRHVGAELAREQVIVNCQ